MSTILQALEKRREEGETGSDPEAILARNAGYRQALRQPPRRSVGQRTLMALAAVCLVSVVLCLLATIFVWTHGSSRDPGRSTTVEGATSPTVPAPAGVPSDKPGLAPDVRETVRLRARPLLRPAPITDPAGPYAQAIPTPLPMEAVVATHGSVPPGTNPPTAPAASGTEPPTVSPSEAPAKPPAARKPTDFLSLTGVILDPRNPSALINGQIVHVGDEIEGATVLAIDSGSSVQVEYQGVEYKLILD